MKVVAWWGRRRLYVAAWLWGWTTGRASKGMGAHVSSSPEKAAVVVLGVVWCELGMRMCACAWPCCPSPKHFSSMFFATPGRAREGDRWTQTAPRGARRRESLKDVSSSWSFGLLASSLVPALCAPAPPLHPPTPRTVVGCSIEAATAWPPLPPDWVVFVGAWPWGRRMRATHTHLSWFPLPFLGGTAPHTCLPPPPHPTRAPGGVTRGHPNACPCLLFPPQVLLASAIWGARCGTHDFPPTRVGFVERPCGPCTHDARPGHALFWMCALC